MRSSTVVLAVLLLSPTAFAQDPTAVEPEAPNAVEPTDEPEVEPRVEPVEHTVQSPSVAVQTLPPPPPATPPPVSPPTVVRVRAGNQESRGFVHVDGRHVVTSAAVVRDRARPRLVDDGGSRRLEVVSVDDERGLALLRAETDVGTPGTLGTIEVGDRVRQGDTTALVLVVREGTLSTSEICTAGAPLLNDRGQIVAICTSRTDATLTDALTSLTDAPTGAPSPWRARVAIGLDYRVRKGFDSTLGGELGFGVLGYDRLGFMLRSAFFQTARSDDESIRLRSAFELTAEVQIQHAFRLGPLPLRFGLGVGATYRPVRERRVQELLELEPGCDPTTTPCRATYSVSRTESDTDHRILPSVRFGIAVGGIAFAYTAAIDTEAPEATTHTLTIGTGL